jgi:DNA-binding response OmpR family regulator
MSYLMESFESFSASRKIRLHFIPQMGIFNMDYDPDKVLKIVANLLSNAIKFTEPGGDVYVVVSTNKLIKSPNDSQPKLNALLSSKESLIIQVRDTGIGISEDDLQSIFDRFYQVANKQSSKHQGTGIGLAFTQELVRLLDGHIYVESEMGKGSLFTVILPVTRDFPLVSEAIVKDVVSEVMVVEPENRSNTIEVLSQESELPLVLVIEDNVDVRNYISLCLRKHYQLSLAVDGQQGIELARDIVPDLVISDVMMPKKDGYELCQEIKKDVRTSHIPVILLTAKVEAASRITGLRAGADAYLGKPFNEEELLVRSEQLIASRKRLQERYQQGISTISLQTKNTSFQREDSFIMEVQKAIIDHLDDETFDSEKLCRKMGMSLSPLYRKIKALTGKSTAVYIRSVRLTRAYELLRQTEKSVSEIAYEVGFKDAAYFSRCFSEEYGESPRSVRN